MSPEQIMDAIRRVVEPAYVGECVHTSLRKGCDGGMTAHRAITDIPGAEWTRAMQFFTEGLLHDIEQALEASA